MRFIDIAVATTIALVSTSTMAFMNPDSFNSVSERHAREATLRAALFDFVSDVGVAWILSASPASLCARLASASNSTIVYSADFGAAGCPSPPPGSISASLPLPFRSNPVVLLAWRREGA